MEQQEARRIRRELLDAFDIYKINVLYGIETETDEEREEILKWYQLMLGLPEDISIYKEIPGKIKHYLKQIY